jgi:uncharacterized glyoxalase superfamily protein PhnB
MPLKPTPDGFHSVTPYLIVSGVLRLIDFLKASFDAQETERLMRPDGSVMHAEVRIGDSNIMMGEPAGQFQPMPGSMYVYVEDADAAYQRALRAGAASVMEPADQFYGDRMAGVRDHSGNLWWIATHKEDVPPWELAKRAAASTKQPAGA